MQHITAIKQEASNSTSTQEQLTPRTTYKACRPKTDNDQRDKAGPTGQHINRMYINSANYTEFNILLFQQLILAHT
jgi:hypothetical protein